jgi:hypothetical protein
LGTTFFVEGFQSFRSAFSLFSLLWFGLLGFLVFILGILYPIEKKYHYQLFLAAGVVLITTLITAISSLGRGLLISLGTISCYYLATYWIKKWDIPKKESSTLSVRKILAGERINKKLTIPHWKYELHEWIVSSPLRFQRLLELPNLLLL